MYDDWADIDLSWGESSVLDRLTPSVSRTVTISVVEDLARQISAHSCSLTNDTEVRWCTQVLCYGLGLPFSTDYVTIRHIVKIYCEWLTCIIDEPNLSVPRPLLEQPAKYARDIINHLHHLFAPRAESGSDIIIRQAKECHYVLRCLQAVALRCKQEMKDEMWLEILRFLLSVNDALLSPPYESDDISDQLCSRTLGVLFELWISACFSGQFPTPSYWKTFRSLCHNWRHRVPLIDQWAKACFVLSSAQLKNLYGPDYCQMKLTPDDQKLVSLDADPQLVAQTWFRMLHLIGSPADILNTHNFDSSPRFREYVGTRSPETGVVDPSQHPCLHRLPYCFFRAMSCANLLVSSFLGESTDCTFRGPDAPSGDDYTPISGPQLTVPHQTGAPPTLRRGVNTGKTKDSRSHSVFVGKSAPAHSTVNLTTPTDSLLITSVLKNSPAKYRMNVTYSAAKPSIDSLLRLFGDWLFACAAAKPVDPKRAFQEDTWSQKSMSSQHSASDSADTMSGVVMSKSSSQSELTRLSSDSLGGVHGLQAGKAEAAAALCKIFCSRGFSERVAENHIAKFCAVLLDLFSHEDYIAHASVVYHGVNIFRTGLRGVELLVPNFLDCLDHFIMDVEKMRVHPSIADIELRRACLDLLASIIVYPTHFGTSAFSDINRNTEQHTFIGFRSRILRILLNSMKLETDTNNIQIGLGLLCLFHQSCSLYEHNAGTLQNMNYIREMLRTILTLLSENLCGKWSSDYGVCLSALDCLVSLAEVEELEPHSQDYPIFERVLIAICRFIELQLSRPPPAHSRDLHSTVVAAYNCLEQWIVSFPFVLHSEFCLNQITEIIQLGVTGAKPQSKELDSTDIKKPASQRVHDAAEQLLHTMFCKAGAPFSIHEPMEDESFLAHAVGIATNQADGAEPWRSRFLYALLDNTCLFGVIETETVNDDGEKVPTAAVILRSPYATVSSWLFRLETHSKGKIPSRSILPRRQEGVDTPPPKYLAPTCIPPDVDKFGKCKADASFPALHLTAEAERVKTYIEEVANQQKWVDWKKDPKFAKLDAKPPSRDSFVHTARLLLQDLGYLDYDSVEDKFRLLHSVETGGTVNSNFVDDLKSVDRCPARFIHTVHIFYVENGKTNVTEILANGTQLEKTAMCFRRFLATLGVAIDVGKDRVWTGHWSTAYMDNVGCDRESHTIDGLSHALYWASPLAEIAFVMPSIASHRMRQSQMVTDKTCRGVSVTLHERPLTASDTSGARWRAQSLEDLLLDVQEEEDEDSDAANISSASAGPVLDDSTNISPPISPIDNFRRRPGGRLRTLFFGRRRQSTLGMGYGTTATSLHALNADAGPGTLLDPMNGRPPPPPPPRSKSVSSQDFETIKPPASAPITGTKLKRSQAYQDYRFLIVWLEKFEDFAAVPADELASLADIGETNQLAEVHRYVMFICPYENGLYRIKLSAQWSKLGYPSPLVDGIVVSEDILSLATRQTILSIGARRRLEQEGYLPPFVKRRQKIHEFAGKYAMNVSPAEAFCALLMR